MERLAVDAGAACEADVVFICVPAAVITRATKPASGDDGGMADVCSMGLGDPGVGSCSTGPLIGCAAPVLSYGAAWSDDGAEKLAVAAAALPRLLVWM